MKRFEYYSALERILSKLEELKRQIEHIETIGLYMAIKGVEHTLLEGEYSQLPLVKWGLREVAAELYEREHPEFFELSEEIAKIGLEMWRRAGQAQPGLSVAMTDLERIFEDGRLAAKAEGCGLLLATDPGRAVGEAFGIIHMVEERLRKARFVLEDALDKLVGART